MARIQLNLPEHFPFSTDLAVRITEINYGGHLGNDALLSLLHEARYRYLKAQGFASEREIGGQGLVISDVAIIYKRQAFYGDILSVAVAVGDFNKYGCDVFYQVRNPNGQEVARAKTGIVFFNYDRQQVVRVPEAFLKLNPQAD